MANDNTSSIVADSVAIAHIQELEFDAQATGQFAVLPGGYQVHNLEAFQARPNTIKASHTFADVTSLAAYCATFGWPEQALFTSDYAAMVLRADLDYHAVDAASHNAHSASFKAALHPKFAAWLAIDGKTLSQIDFATFLEDHALDIVVPDAATIMETVLQFEATKAVQFRQSTRLADGSRQFSYTEENQARGAITLPSSMMINAPVLIGMDSQDITFNLRFRIDDAKLRFQLVLPAKEELIGTAFDTCVAEFAAQIAASGRVKPILRKA